MALVAQPIGTHRHAVLGQSHAFDLFRRFGKPSGANGTRHKGAGGVSKRHLLAFTSRTTVIAAVAAPVREAEPQTDRVLEREVFQWTKQWYPLVPLKLLEESQGEGYASGVPEIQRQSILGRDIVLWKDSEGEWRAVEDRCAHRLAALSLGSVQEDGTLACRYHGWCFNGWGECTHIPQAPDAASKSTACSSSRSKIQAFPTLKAHGLLWVWPDDAPTAWDDAAAEDPAIGGVSGPDASWLATFNFPTTYATFIENVVDPTHVLYVHHGQKFEKGKVFAPEKAIPMSDFKTVGKISAKGGFKLMHAPFTTDDEWSSTTNTFRPPCSSSVETVFPDGRVTFFDFLFCPTKPGHVSFFVALKRDASKQQKPEQGFSGLKTVTRNLANVVSMIRGLPMKLAFKLLPSYLLIGLFHHSGVLLNQDMVILNSQDLALARTQHKMYLPTPSDTGVVAWRSWLTQFGGGEPKWFGGSSEAAAVLQRSDLFDRWQRHSKWCPASRKSLKFLEGVETLLSRATAALLGCALLLAAFRVVDVRVAVGAVIAAGISILGRFEVQRLRKRFLTAVPSTGIPEVSLQWPS